ncbi:MAG: sigma-54 dependent transcriptional regulator [Polyangia bacterium]
MAAQGAYRRIVIADDEPSLRKVLGSLLRREGYDVAEARDGEEALALLGPDVAVLLTDLRMPRLDGMALFRRAVTEYPDLKVIIWTAYGRITESVEAVKLGAFDFIEKGDDNEHILQVVRKAVRSFELDQRAPRRVPVPASMGRFGLIGTSPSLQHVFQLIDKVADTPSTVLITGESGTGKELVARALHEHSSRRGEAFIKINCAAIPKTLMESELFGYDKGAFTGAVSSKPGRFELADRGTLFLDEIGELPVEMQVKLLRVLQESEFERVGGIKTLRVDVRVIAATNRDLVREVAQGTFREELYYRLNVVPIGLPPLRERPQDIPLLVNHFIARFNERLRKSIDGLTPEAMELLLRYPFPGNIRELENILERTVLLAEGPVIAARDLPPALSAASPAVTAPSPAATATAAPIDRSLPGSAVPVAQPQPAPSSGPQIGPPRAAPSSLKEIVRQETERVEREMIQRALAETAGNVTQAARALGISRKSLQTKMKELGLRDRDDKSP